ncbi:HIT domain-containing protein [Bartonella sp. W8098]|uniref:HIT domain-containing protein n=1 Tax=Bartonella TaxID=773 RepID=UPI0018DCBABA|nr:MULTISPECIES: HIT family protein [Bartonella]MBH9986719.1 HIT domain-containing protein [Bartonella apis]MBI0171231.1 HIT domain-containing protein [Bartonella sp. W8151]
MEINTLQQPFKLDPRLEKDSFFIVELALSDVRLMNDSRWPWLIVVPRIAGAEEIHHLSVDDEQVLVAEMNEVAVALEAITGCDKVNIAAIGNIVRQLHVHIIARNEGDANWPKTVWGYGESVLYSDEAAHKLIRKLQLRLD